MQPRLEKASTDVTLGGARFAMLLKPFECEVHQMRVVPISALDFYNGKKNAPHLEGTFHYNAGRKLWASWESCIVADKIIAFWYAKNSLHSTDLRSTLKRMPNIAGYFITKHASGNNITEGMRFLHVITLE